MLFGYRGQIAAMAVGNRLPAISGAKEFAEAGLLLHYGVDFPDQFRRSASFVDKIFKGAKPADLPVEQPTKFELVINLKTAKALGIVVPPTLLAPRRRGDRMNAMSAIGRYRILSALSRLNAIDRCQDKPARKKPEQRRNNLCAETGQHDALVGHQPEIPCLRDVRCCDVENLMLKSGFNPGPRLKIRRHRTGTERRHAHSARSEFLAERFAERQDIRLGRIIHRHPGARQKAGKRTDIEDTAAMPDEAVGKP